MTGDGLKDISIKAGVNASFASSNMEEQMILAWDGTAYAVASRTTESTPTHTTTTPLPFSATCDYKASGVQYINPPLGEDKVPAIQKFLNAGGDPQKLKDTFDITVKDLTNDSVPEIMLIHPSDLIL